MPADLLAFGWRVRSAIEIPGAVAIAPGRVDVEIVRGRSIEVPPVTSPYALTANGFTFTVPGLARYVCEGAARTVIVEPAVGASEARLGAMLVATMLPALAWVRGELVLHAAAAVLPGTGRAVAIAGVSGVGKSMLLARMVAAGASAVADDSFRVSNDRSIAGLPGGRYRSVDGERLFVPFAPAAQYPRAPLGAVVILSAGCSAPERLTGVEAVAALLAQRHRPTIARLMRREGELLPAIVALAAAVPIVRWPAPQSPCYRTAGLLRDGRRDDVATA